MAVCWVSVSRQCADLDHVEDLAASDYDWCTCHKDAKEGDYALIYATSPLCAFVGIQQFTRDAEHQENEFSRHPYITRKPRFQKLEVPLTLKAMREDKDLRESKMVRCNFQSAAPFQIEGSTLRALAKYVPALKPLLAR